MYKRQPYKPVKAFETKMIITMVRIGTTTETIPTDKPLINTVAEPVSADFAISDTGLPAVKYSVTRPMIIPPKAPAMIEYQIPISKLKLFTRKYDATINANAELNVPNLREELGSLKELLTIFTKTIPANEHKSPIDANINGMNIISSVG